MRKKLLLSSLKRLEMMEEEELMPLKEGTKSLKLIILKCNLN
jgi:hypothetical protein